MTTPIDDRWAQESAAINAALTPLRRAESFLPQEGAEILPVRTLGAIAFALVDIAQTLRRLEAGRDSSAALSRTYGSGRG